MNIKIIIYVLILALTSLMVEAVQCNDYNDCLTRSVTDFLYCPIYGGCGGGNGSGKAGDPPYLYNDTTTIYFNETYLNLTIDDKISGVSGNSSFNQSMMEAIIDNESIIRWWNLSWLVTNQIYDGNASSICADNTYLDGNGLCIDFNNTVSDVISTEDTYVKIAGDTMGGDLNMDGNYFQLDAWNAYIYYTANTLFLMSDDAIELSPLGDFTNDIVFNVQGGNVVMATSAKNLGLYGTGGTVSVIGNNDLNVSGELNVSKESQINNTLIKPYNSTCPTWITCEGCGSLILCT